MKHTKGETDAKIKVTEDLLFHNTPAILERLKNKSGIYPPWRIYVVAYTLRTLSVPLPLMEKLPYL